MEKSNIVMSNRTSGEQVFLVPEGNAISLKVNHVNHGKVLTTPSILSSINTIEFNNRVIAHEATAKVTEHKPVLFFKSVTAKDSSSAQTVASATTYVGLKEAVFSLFSAYEKGATTIVTHVKQLFLEKNGEAFCIKNNVSEKKLTTCAFESAMVNEQPDKILHIEDRHVIVYDKTPSSFVDVLNVSPVTVVVDDYRPPSTGSNLSGEGIRFIRLVAQKNAYAEIFLNFTERKTVHVIGLPDGMILEKGVIKGSPTTSGTYPLSIKLDNDTILEALLIVPALPRLL